MCIRVYNGIFPQKYYHYYYIYKNYYQMYRKLPLKNTGDIQNLPDGTILVKNHWIFSH